MCGEGPTPNGKSHEQCPVSNVFLIPSLGISCDIKIVAIVRTPLVLETLSILKVNRLPSRKCAPYTFPDRRHSSPKIRRKEQEVKTMVVIWEICIVDIPFIANIAKAVQCHSLSVMSLLFMS